MSSLDISRDLIYRVQGSGRASRSASAHRLNLSVSRSTIIRVNKKLKNERLGAENYELLAVCHTIRSSKQQQNYRHLKSYPEFRATNETDLA